MFVIGTYPSIQKQFQGFTIICLTRVIEVDIEITDKLIWVVTCKQ